MSGLDRFPVYSESKLLNANLTIITWIIHLFLDMVYMKSVSDFQAHIYILIMILYIMIHIMIVG